MVLPIRLITCFTLVLITVILVSIFSIGHNFKKGPMKSGCRKKLIKTVFITTNSLYLIVAGLRTNKKHLDIDYTEYLGPDYKKNERKIKRVSTIVSNHVSWIDPVVLIKTIYPAFAPSSEFRNFPILNRLIDSLDSIYIPRGGSAENKAKALKAIGYR